MIKELLEKVEELLPSADIVVKVFMDEEKKMSDHVHYGCSWKMNKNDDVVHVCVETGKTWIVGKKL